MPYRGTDVIKVWFKYQYTDQVRNCPAILSPGESIQQAIDTAPSGAVICLGEGTWEENLVIVGKSLTIRGAGAGKTVIRGTEHEPVVWIEGDKIEVSLEGVTITGDSWLEYFYLCDPPKRCYIGLVAKGSAQVRLKNSTVSDNWGKGLWVEDSAQVSLQESTVSHNGVGLLVVNSARMSLQDCTISGNEGSGLRLEFSAQVSLQDSTVSGNGGNGLDVWGSAQVTLQDSQVSSNGKAGILLGDSAQVSIAGSFIEGNGTADVYEEDWPCSGIEVRGKAHSSLRTPRSGTTPAGASQLVLRSVGICIGGLRRHGALGEPGQ